MDDILEDQRQNQVISQKEPSKHGAASASSSKDGEDRDNDCKSWISKKLMFEGIHVLIRTRFLKGTYRPRTRIKKSCFQKNLCRTVVCSENSSEVSKEEMIVLDIPSTRKELVAVAEIVTYWHPCTVEFSRSQVPDGKRSSIRPLAKRRSLPKSLKEE